MAIKEKKDEQVPASYVSLATAAKMLNVTKTTLRAYLRAGEIPAILTPNRQWLVDVSAVGGRGVAVASREELAADGYLPVEEAAVPLRTHAGTVARWCREGKVPAKRDLDGGWWCASEAVKPLAAKYVTAAEVCRRLNLPPCALRGMVAAGLVATAKSPGGPLRYDVEQAALAAKHRKATRGRVTVNVLMQLFARLIVRLERLAGAAGAGAEGADDAT
jgi:excisionase family DNA binding protein